MKEETKRKISDTLKRKGIRPKKIFSGRGIDNSFFGRHHSEASKQKNRLAHLGKPNLKNKKYNLKKICLECYVEFPIARWNNFRKFCSPQCSALTQSKSMEGENNPAWIDGRSRLGKNLRNTVEYARWRLSVFKRDNFTCQICGIRDGKIQADHIKPYALFPELRLDINNGRTLCPNCHRNTDTWGTRQKGLLIYV